MTLVWWVVAAVYAAVLSLSLPQTKLTRVEHLLLLVIIPSVTVVFARIATAFVTPYNHDFYRRPGGSALPSPSIVTNLTKLLIFAMGGLVILQSFGIAITPILTALGVGGLAVALALQDTLSNLFAGLYIIAARDMKPGDYIRLNSGEEGYIVDIDWRNTELRILSNMIVVPNAKLAVANITNYEQPDKEVLVPVQMGVAYENNLEQVERAALQVARETLREHPAPWQTLTPCCDILRSRNRASRYDPSSAELRRPIPAATCVRQTPSRAVSARRDRLPFGVRSSPDDRQRARRGRHLIDGDAPSSVGCAWGNDRDPGGCPRASFCGRGL